MKINLNGHDRDLAGTTVADAVATLCDPAPPTGIAVAVNAEVVPRSAWDTPLAPGDRVEILTATQGG